MCLGTRACLFFGGLAYFPAQQNGDANAASDVRGTINHAATFIYGPLLVPLLFTGGEYHHNCADTGLLFDEYCLKPLELRQIYLIYQKP